MSKCPDKYYIDSGVCMPCDPKCKSCEQKVNYCINGCEEPFLYKNHQCLTDCGEGFAGNKGYCEPCDPACKSCIYEGNIKICLRCDRDRFLYNKTCLSECPPGLSGNIENGSCEPCNEACSLCFGNSFRDCYECNSNLGYIMVSENTCMFPTCTDGFYYNHTMKLCQNCPKECTTCISSTNCTSCQKGYFLDYEIFKCKDKCNKLGFTRKTNAQDECTEICGDGRNMGFLECDDGNLNDNDGCSSECKIEKFYECTGGNSDNADICINRKPLEIYSFKYYGNRTAVLIFDKICLLQKITDEKKNIASLEEIIKFYVEKENNMLPVDWTYEKFSKDNFKRLTFQINLNFSLNGAEVFF